MNDNTGVASTKQWREPDDIQLTQQQIEQAKQVGKAIDQQNATNANQSAAMPENGQRKQQLSHVSGPSDTSAMMRDIASGKQPAPIDTATTQAKAAAMAEGVADPQADRMNSLAADKLLNKQPATEPATAKTGSPSASPEQQEQQTQQAAQQSQQPSDTPYTDYILKSMEKPMDTDELRKQQQRLRRNQAIVNIGQGIAAIANVVGAAHQGTPYQLPTNTRFADKAEKLEQQQREYRQKYYTLLSKAQQADDKTRLARQEAQRKAAKDAADAKHKADQLQQQTAYQTGLLQAKDKDRDANIDRWDKDRKVKIDIANQADATKRRGQNITAAHNRATEGIAAANLSLKRQQFEYKKATGGGGKKNNNTIRVRDRYTGKETVLTYDKDHEGALLNMGNKMAKGARATSDYWKNKGNQKQAQAYGQIAKNLAEARGNRSKMLSLISEYAQDFPSLTEDIYGALEIQYEGKKTSKPKTDNKTTTSYTQIQTPWKKQPNVGWMND